MHADRGGVQDGVEKLGAQRGAGHCLCAESACEYLCGFFAARANGDGSAGTYQRKSGRPGRSTRPKDQDAAAIDAKFFLERTEHAEVIGVAAIKRSVATNDHSVNGANFLRERSALLQILENCLLVWMSDAETFDTELWNSGKKIAELAHQKWEIDSINAARRESRIVQQGRKRMADGIANHSVDPRAARESMRAIKVLHLVQGNLAGGGGLGDGSVSQRTSLA